MSTKIMVLEVRDGEQFTYPVDSYCGLHCIAEELKHHESKKPLSPVIRVLGEMAHAVSEQIKDSIDKGEENAKQV